MTDNRALKIPRARPDYILAEEIKSKFLLSNAEKICIFQPFFSAKNEKNEKKYSNHVSPQKMGLNTLFGIYEYF